jgi:hypothetical protein
MLAPVCCSIYWHQLGSPVTRLHHKLRNNSWWQMMPLQLVRTGPTNWHHMASTTLAPYVEWFLATVDIKVDIFYPLEIYCLWTLYLRSTSVWGVLVSSVTTKHKSSHFNKNKIVMIIKSPLDGTYAVVDWRSNWEKADTVDGDSAQTELVSVTVWQSTVIMTCKWYPNSSVTPWLRGRGACRTEPIQALCEAKDFGVERATELNRRRKNAAETRRKTRKRKRKLRPRERDPR